MRYAAILALIVLASCHDGTTTNPTDKTHIQFANAAPSEQHCDLYLAGGSAPQVAGFYYSLATGYDQPRLADLTVSVKETHVTVNGPTTLNCSKDSYYTWFLYDTFPHLKTLLTTDVRLASIPTNKAAVKFVNLCPNAGNIAYRVQGQSTLATNLQYAGTSSADPSSPYLLMDTGYRYIEVLDATTTAVIDSMPLYIFYANAGKYFTIWTTGYKGGTGDNKLFTWWTEDR